MFHTIFNRFISIVSIVAILVMAAAVPVQAAEFHYSSKANAIVMQGTIRMGDGAKFKVLLRHHPQANSVILTKSVGGEYANSLEMSLEVQRRGLNTIAVDYCRSGCAYIWLAGARREVVRAANPEIHLPYANATGETFPNLTYAWLDALGFPSRFAYAVVKSVGPDNRFVKLTPEFLIKFGAARPSA